MKKNNIKKVLACLLAPVFAFSCGCKSKPEIKIEDLVGDEVASFEADKIVKAKVTTKEGSKEKETKYYEVIKVVSITEKVKDKEVKKCATVEDAFSKEGNLNLDKFKEENCDIKKKK